MEVNALFTLSASARLLAPSAPMLLSQRLRAGNAKVSAAADRLGEGGRAGGLPQRLERGVDLECLGDLLCSGPSKVVLAQIEVLHRPIRLRGTQEGSAFGEW